MLVVFVHVRVKPECVDRFREETIKNACESIKEEGVARFDVFQSQEDKTKFVLVEIYKDDEAPKLHKQTAHYLAWRSAVESMMAEPRYSEKYTNITDI